MVNLKEEENRIQKEIKAGKIVQVRFLLDENDNPTDNGVIANFSPEIAAEVVKKGDKYYLVVAIN